MGLVDSLCRIGPRATALQGCPSDCRAMGPLHRAAGIWAGNTTECPEGWHFPSSASGAHPRGCGRTRSQNTMGPVHFGSEHPPCWSLRGPVLTSWVAPPLVRPQAPPHLLATVHLPHAHVVHGPWPSWKLVPFRCCHPAGGKVGVLVCPSVSESPRDLPWYAEEREALPSGAAGTCPTGDLWLTVPCWCPR